MGLYLHGVIHFWVTFASTPSDARAKMLNVRSSTACSDSSHPQRTSPFRPLCRMSLTALSRHPRCHRMLRRKFSEADINRSVNTLVGSMISNAKPSCLLQITVGCLHFALLADMEDSQSRFKIGSLWVSVYVGFSLFLAHGYREFLLSGNLLCQKTF